MVFEVQTGDSIANPLAISETGEIQARGQPVMPGYRNKPLADEETLINGRLMTGDVGVMDEDG